MSVSSNKNVVAVTGAAGFIGSHVVESFLAAGWEVRALVRYNALGSIGHLAEVKARLAGETAGRLSVVTGDICDQRCLREFVRGCQAVCHLAALIGIPYSYRAPESYVQTNVTGTLSVLEACREEDVGRLLHTSTSEVYGSARTVPMGENHPLQAQSPYSATKIAADKLVESYFLSFGLPIITIRPFNTFGPRQSLRAVIPAIVAQALSPRCEEIRLGSLDPVRDLTFVEDTARAFRIIAEAPLERVKGRLYNLGTGKGHRIGELAEQTLGILGVEKPIVCDATRLRPAASEVQRLISDNSRIIEETGWRPEVGLDEGLSRTAEWIGDRLGNWDPGRIQD